MDKVASDQMVSELVEEHYQFLYRYGYRLTGSTTDAEDLTQQTFLTVQTKLHQLRERSRVRAWLCAIIRNAYFKSQRNQACCHQSIECVSEPTALTGSAPAIDREVLQKLLNEMPVEFRIPLISFYFDEFSYKEIAEQMDVPIGTIMSRLSRGKKFLRSRLLGSQSDFPVMSDSTPVRA